MIERFRNVQLLPYEKTVIDEVTKHDLIKKDMLDGLARMIRHHTEVRDSIQNKTVAFNNHPEEVLELDLVVIDYKSFQTILKLLHADSWPNATWGEFNQLFKTFLEENK